MTLLHTPLSLVHPRASSKTCATMPCAPLTPARSQRSAVAPENGTPATPRSTSQEGPLPVIADRQAPARAHTVRLLSSSRNAMTLSVVIPALNEQDGIAAIVERIEAIRKPLATSGVDGLEIIVVDDGSHDRTPEIAASYASVRLIRHAVNHGYGAAIKTGFHSARGQLLAFTDADGTYPPERFP